MCNASKKAAVVSIEKDGVPRGSRVQTTPHEVACLKRSLAVHRETLRTGGLYPASEGERLRHSAIKNLFGVEYFETVEGKRWRNQPAWESEAAPR